MCTYEQPIDIVVPQVVEGLDDLRNLVHLARAFPSGGAPVEFIDELAEFLDNVERLLSLLHLPAG